MFNPEEVYHKYSEPWLCFSLGMFRNLSKNRSLRFLKLFVIYLFSLVFSVAYADFNCVAIISCCVARQSLCRFVKHQDTNHTNILLFEENVLETVLSMTNMTFCLVGRKYTSPVLPAGS